MARPKHLVYNEKTGMYDPSYKPAKKTGKKTGVKPTAKTKGKERIILTYVLKLEGGYFYVGRTDDLNKRYAEHADGKGAEWTKLHPPVTIYRVYLGNVEDIITDKFRDKYGNHMVRGGAYVSVLDPNKKCFNNASSEYGIAEVHALFSETP